MNVQAALGKKANLDEFREAIDSKVDHQVLKAQLDQ